MAFSIGSFYSKDTNASIVAYAKAANDSSYKYYNNMTWSMWTSAQPGINKHLWSMWEESGNNRSWVFSVQDDGTFRIIFSHDGSGLSALYLTNTAVFNCGWNHIVITFASGTFNVYVNDSLQTLTAIIAWSAGSVALHAAGQQLMVGSLNPASPPIDSSIGGCYSNYSLWNKVLDTGERTELYNSGRPADLSAHSAVANLTNWWRMDQTDSAPTLADSQNGSGSDMTITTSGANARFAASTSCPSVDDYPAEADVLSGVDYNLGENTGSLSYPANSDIRLGVMGGTLDLPAESDVLIGVVFDNMTKTGTLELEPTAAEIAAAVWDAPLVNHTTADTYGTFVKKTLTVAKFLGLK